METNSITLYHREELGMFLPAPKRAGSQRAIVYAQNSRTLSYWRFGVHTSGQLHILLSMRGQTRALFVRTTKRMRGLTPQTDIGLADSDGAIVVAMTDRELAVELLRFCEGRVLDSMAKTSALKTVLAMKPTLSSGSTLNDAYVHYLEQSARDAAWTMIHDHSRN